MVETPSRRGGIAVGVQRTEKNYREGFNIAYCAAERGADGAARRPYLFLIGPRQPV